MPKLEDVFLVSLFKSVLVYGFKDYLPRNLACPGYACLVLFSLCERRVLVVSTVPWHFVAQSEL